MRFQKIGDIVILRQESDYNSSIKAKTVCVRAGKIEGQLREPNLKVIRGSDTVTTHTENGCKFNLDVAKVMFSKGNIAEKKRLSIVSNHKETVIDMFAGIGYFTIPLAVHSGPKIIYAVELNQTAYKYLCENIELNKVQNIVKPILGDSIKNLPNVKADRILMGLLPSAEAFLPAALAHSKKGTIIHYHGIAKNAEVLVKQVKKATSDAGFGCEVLNISKVKSYAPRVWHFVIDAKIA